MAIRTRPDCASFASLAMLLIACGAKSELAECASWPSCDGSCDSKVLAHAGSDATLNVDGARAYWSDRTADSHATIVATSAGEAISTVWTANDVISAPVAIEFDSDAVFWVEAHAFDDHGELWRADKPGGLNPKKLALLPTGARGEYLLHVASDRVYLGLPLSETIVSFDKISPGDGQVFVDNERLLGQFLQESVISDSTSVYWMSSSGNDFVVSRRAKSGGPIAELARRPLRWISGFFSDDSGTYWAWGVDCNTEILRIRPGEEQPVAVGQIPSVGDQIVRKGGAFALLDPAWDVQVLSDSGTHTTVCTCLTQGARRLTPAGYFSITDSSELTAVGF